MNRKFSCQMPYNELIKNPIEDVLKFYQTTVKINEFLDTKKNESNNIINEYWKLPDGYLKSYKFNEFPENFKLILENFKLFLCEKDDIYFCPIFIFKDITNIENGIYSLDFMSNTAYKFKEIDSTLEETMYLKCTYNMGIVYFLKLEYSIGKELQQGFIDGLLQIGGIYDRVQNCLDKSSFTSESITVPQQQFTKMVGVSCREQLLIANQMIKEK